MSKHSARRRVLAPADARAETVDLALLLPSLSGGGAERVMMDLAYEAAARGFRVDVVVVNNNEAIVSDLGTDVRLINLNRTRVAFALPAWLGYLRATRPSAVLSTLGHANVLAVAGARLVSGIRVVVREAVVVGHDLEELGYKRRAIRYLMRWAYGAANAVVAVSEGVSESLVRDLGLPPHKVEVIFNPAITPRVLAGAQDHPEHHWFGPGELPVVLGVGRLTEQKGFDTLLRAFAEARKSEPCRLLILGDGPLRSELMALARALGVEAEVEMPGFADNPFAYMAHCGVFVLSSRWEGLPNALIQAMAVGARAVSTDCPSGPREVTDGGRLAHLVEVDDIHGIAGGMVSALRSPQKKPGQDWSQRYALKEVATSYFKVLGLEGPRKE